MTTGNLALSWQQEPTALLMIRAVQADWRAERPETPGDQIGELFADAPYENDRLMTDWSRANRLVWLDERRRTIAICDSDSTRALDAIAASYSADVKVLTPDCGPTCTTMRHYWVHVT